MGKITHKTTNIQPNIITNRSVKYSALAEKIFYLIIHDLKNKTAIQKELSGNIPFEISTKDLQNPNPSRIQEACKQMKKTEFLIKPVKGQSFRDITPFPDIAYNGKNRIKVVMYEGALPYFQELSQGFTTYKLLAALSLKKTYSQRLYELLNSWKNTGVWYIKLDKLKELVGVENKTYNYATFKKRVLISAQEEINKKTDISFTFKEHKTGRSYTDITFKIDCDKPTKELPAEIKEDATPIKKDPDYDRIKDILLERYAITAKNYVNQIVKQKKAFWKLNNEYLKNKDNVVKPIKNPAGFILTGLNIK